MGLKARTLEDLVRELLRPMLQVWLDRGGIHFKRGGTACAEGNLSWDLALALSLVPDPNSRQDKKGKD